LREIEGSDRSGRPAREQVRLPYRCRPRELAPIVDQGIAEDRSFEHCWMLVNDGFDLAE